MRETKVYATSIVLRDADGDHIYEIDMDNEEVIVELEAVLYFSPEMKEILRTFDYGRIHMLAEAPGIDRIWMTSDIPIDQLAVLKLAKAQFKFTVDSSIADELHVTLAYSSKHNGDMGMTASIESGTFFETYIPINRGGRNDGRQ